MVVTNQLSLTEFYHNKRVLVTGASGYIAWNLVKQLSDYNCTVVCFSRLVDKIERQRGNANFEFIEGSYQDESLYPKSVKNVDIIFHLASQTSVYEAEKNPIADYEANVRPMQLLLEACRKEKTCPIVVFSGTSTQCGMPEEIPVDENVIDDPITTYDFHKMQAERWLKFYTRQGWIKGVSLRLTNVYGPGPENSSADRGILNLMINKALQGKELTVYGTGDYLRDYIYIEDVVSVFLLAPNHINDLKGKHFVLGSGEGKTINDSIHLVGKLVTQKTDKKVVVKNVKSPPGLHQIEFRDFVSDISAFCLHTKWKPKYNLREGIVVTITSNITKTKN